MPCPSDRAPAYRCFQLLLCLVVIPSLQAREALCQGSVSFSLNGGVTKVDVGGETFLTTSKPMFGVGMAYTYGNVFKGGNAAFVFSGGLQAYQYSANGSYLSGQLTVLDYRTPVTMGARIGVVGLGAYFDYRLAIRTFDGADGGNMSGLFYGPYLRVGLGPFGSAPGRWALEGRYLWGTGSFTDVGYQYTGRSFGETQSLDWGSDTHDWRAGLSFQASPHLVIRGEYSDTQYTINTETYIASLKSLNQTQKSYLLTIGYILTP